MQEKTKNTKQVEDDHVSEDEKARILRQIEQEESSVDSDSDESC
jgi:hypothetical protein